MDYKKLLFNKNKVYETKFFLYQYNDNNLRIVKQKYARNKGFEDVKINGDKVDKDEVERISISRTRRNIRELALCNNFEYFATFTLDPNKCDRYSLTECQIIHEIKNQIHFHKNHKHLLSDHENEKHHLYVFQ